MKPSHLGENLLEGSIAHTEEFAGLTAEFKEALEYMLSDMKANTYTLRSSQGIILNDYLPKGFKVVDQPGTKECGVMFGVIYLDLFYYLSLGVEGAITICHEIGHCIDGFGVVWGLSIEADKGTDEYYLEIFEKSLERTSTIWRSEVKAWENGKIFADLLGISTELYEQRMTNALATYYVYHLIDIISDIRGLQNRNLVDENKIVKYYDIWRQETVRLTMGNFISNMLKREEAMKALKQKIESPQEI